MSEQPVVTTHIQMMIRNALEIAQNCNGAGQYVRVGDKSVPTIDALEKASADLRHAAEELTAERLSLLGWPQT